MRVALAVLALASGCELSKIELPIAPSSVVIHGVLSPSALSQSVLIERTLTGQAAVPIVTPFDVSNPIISDNGVAEDGATVELTTPGGQTIVGHEASASATSGAGAGVYQLALVGSTLVQGGHYRLRIVTRQQEVVTAETIVPAAAPVLVGPTVDFNRARDTLSLSWSPVAKSRGYEVRIESPYGPWIEYTDATHISVTGTLRNLIADNLPNLFVPGFRQIVTVSAVDSNMYDYYRSSNNAFIGAGVVSHVSGGTGVFGALVTVARRTLSVTAPLVDPIEGSFNLQLGSLGYFYGGAGDAMSLALYVESHAVRSDQPDAITGGYRRSNGTFGAAVGTLTGNHLKLVFLADQFLTDTVDVFTADLVADTLAGKFSKGAQAKYVR